MKLQLSRPSPRVSSFPPLLLMVSPTYKGKNRNLVGSIPPEEGVRLPARARGTVGGVEEQSAREFLVESGGLEIDRLVHVIGWLVVAVGGSVLENCLFRCALVASYVAIGRRNI